MPFFSDVVRALTTFLTRRRGQRLSCANDTACSHISESALDASIVGEAFRCLSRFFRAMSNHIFSHDESRQSGPIPPLRTHLQTGGAGRNCGAMAVLKEHYVLLLGHKKEFVRTLAAESFALLVRKLHGAALRAHVRQLGSSAFVLFTYHIE